MLYDKDIMRARGLYLLLFLLALAAVAVACGDDGPAPGGNDAAPGGNDASGDATPPVSCEDAAQALAAELYSAPQACSVVVRLDYQTRGLLGYQVMCGPYSGTDEATARATAQADTGYGETGDMVSAADVYIFYLSPGDFGGVAAVSASTGLSLFGGSIVWNGVGDITYPSAWRPAADLGAMCSPSGGLGPTRGYDLVLGAELDQATADEIGAVVAQTAVPDAIWRGGYVFDTVILVYPRTVGAFDPSTAEWVVMVNGGWLE